MFVFSILAITAVAYMAWPVLKQEAIAMIVANPVATLNKEDKEALYDRLAEDLPGIYDAAPDANVGKLLQRNIDKTQRGARILGNNAGFRDDRSYGPKKAGVYRIICLGDSLVEGTGGNEEDRFCDLIEENINEHGLLGEGLIAEAYALGIGSWTAVNAAAYMISHISDYDPDLIIALMVSNDIADGQGISGLGMSSNAFSPENRDLGSGLFSEAISINFGGKGNYLKFDLGPESTKRWEKAFSFYRRLENLQHERGKKMVFSVLDTIQYFSELARKYHSRFEMTSPFLATNYFPSERTRLPHDGHPNRHGHQIIANHYLHSLVQQGWISDPENRLSALHPDLSLEISTAPDQDYLARTRQELVEDFLPVQIDFGDPGQKEVESYIGGIWPGLNSAPETRHQTYPSGTTKTGFYLAKASDGNSLSVEIYIPPRVELFPNTIQLWINGQLMDSLDLESRKQAGVKILSADLTTGESEADVLEVIITSDTYWSTIQDHTMRSYELRRAFQSAK